ncbi:uncharacterized protein TNCV_4693531 [Trichonephila clavipes]|uniref:Uncharacterized protein n=1 Tax=Trichonephila clavipes TaxID=2585209 RepID=A0A8X6WB25_TRICX|nr:uncharacterized protein TNCV_4693531 [Trichonephila clavipes]
MGVVELNIRIRDFEKPWLFHVLADLEYPCVLGIDFIGGSNIILDFDRKSLAIPDSQINKVIKTVEIEKVEIDLSKTKLEEKQKRELQDLFNSFQGLFSDKPGLTHVLYHEIDTEDNPSVVSRPYKYDRVKQEILDYHVDKMLKEEISDGIRDGTEFAVGDIERLFEEARRNTKTKHEKWRKYYNRHRRDVQIKVNDWVMVATHPLSSATRKVADKFKPKFEGPYRVLDVKNNNVVIWKAGKRLTINVDQVRIYRHRKCDETEIRTGSSDNGNLRGESSGFGRVQRRSNESRDGKKKGSEVKRELEEKGLS